jgi:fatty-acyl-CoA synthase
VRCPYSEINIKKIGSDGGYADCAPGEIGLVTVRGPQVFGGYLEPAHNKNAFTPDGSFITGDLGYLDEEGYLFLSGREKDLIIRSGHNIDPSSIEEVANSHPAVALSAAVGMPDEYAGEVPVVFVAPLPGQRLDISELMDFIALRIHEPPAKPRQVFLIEEIPVTAVGKVFKPQLRDLTIKHKLRDVVGDFSDALELVEIVGLDGAPESFEVRVRPTGRTEFAPAAEALARALAELPVRTQLAALPMN